MPLGLARSSPGQKFARILTFTAAIDPALQPPVSVKLPLQTHEEEKSLRESKTQDDADANLLQRSKIKSPDDTPRKYGQGEIYEGGPD